MVININVCVPKVIVSSFELEFAINHEYVNEVDIEDESVYNQAHWAPIMQPIHQ